MVEPSNKLREACIQNLEYVLKSKREMKLFNIKHSEFQFAGSGWVFFK